MANKRRLLLFWVLLLFIFGSIFFILLNDLRKDFYNNIKDNIKLLKKNCFIKRGEYIVRGSSLEPLIQKGKTIILMRGYYGCYPVRRDDVVACDYAGNKTLLIKIVKGLPGDKFSLQKSEDNSGWNILINGEVLKNSEGDSYILDERCYEMLSLYINDYKGVIPTDAYLILGNNPTGSLDSTHFGLVDKSNFVAKVEF